MGIIPDLFRIENTYGPASPAYQHLQPEQASTDWLPAGEEAEPATLAWSLPSVPADEAHVILLAIGIRYGTPAANGAIQQVRHGGSAKVLAVR